LVVGFLQEHERQFWCPAPLREGEQHWRNLRSEKYQPPAAWLLEIYESDSSVEADEDTDVEVGGDAGTGPDAGGAVKSRRKTRPVLAKQSATTAAAVVSVVKVAEKKMKKNKRNRKTSPPLAVERPAIPTPQSREVESEEEDEVTEAPQVVEDRPVRRSESPATKRQQELVQKMMEDALRQGLEAHRTAAAAQAKMPVLIRPRFSRPKARVLAVRR
jgi:hypothetical protein